MIETVPSGTILHGNYRIERVLGSGGFGHVYLALNQANNNQPCALKEYLVTGTSGQEQLQHEARVLSHLHHPNLPAFSDAFIERGRYYIALSYIEGNDLTDLIRAIQQRNECIPIVQMLHWILAVCDAVMFMHSQQPPIIHRDIKPDNIRITSSGTAVLVDLGNAKAAADGARTLFFIRHQGTPGYAPPEQYPGGTGTDARSDIYAIGGTLYFALTAQEPPSVSARNQSIQQRRPDLPTLPEILAKNPPEESQETHARQFRLGVTKPTKPAPRHSRHLAQLGQIPPEALQLLSMIIQRAMAMRPADRYQYVADLANDLRRAISLLPSPSPDGGSTRENSTQPDLDEAYELLQNGQNANAHQQGSGTQPMGIRSTNQDHSSYTNCPRCQASIPAGAPFCPHCGTQLRGSGSAYAAAQQQVSRNTAYADQVMADPHSHQQRQNQSQGYGIDASKQKPYNSQAQAYQGQVMQQGYSPATAIQAHTAQGIDAGQSGIAGNSYTDRSFDIHKIIPLIIVLVVLALIIFFVFIH